MYIEAPSLVGQPGIRHAFFTRAGGVSHGLYASLNGGLGSQDEPALVAENRSRMAGHLGVAPSHLVSLYQVHSAEVAIIDGPMALADRPRADAMVTRVPNLALGIATADCGPILFADTVGRVVGAAHAGWKGALSGVIAATVEAMERLGSARADITAVLGPTISQAAYEVGDDFRTRFAEEVPGSDAHFAPGQREGHAQFDLPGFIARRLREAGIEKASTLGLCTYADPERFYSYRRTTHRGEADYGRLISAIVLAA
ncbi:peptidoglycan editing factor PgeF [Methylobacterium bullatum]|uniref:Purine nucleoside phosphorylase n=1 Tax=Methylobacterium bullatum TaxID=570505 RepID=A0A679K6K1_9HYPH|nr:Laccase domain protein YfiH [Methylobacterium bullatum]